MSLKKIIWFIVKLQFKVLKAVFIILGAIGGASAGSSNEVKINDYHTGQTLYIISAGRVHDYRTGIALYELKDNRLFFLIPIFGFNDLHIVAPSV